MFCQFLDPTKHIESQNYIFSIVFIYYFRQPNQIHLWVSVMWGLYGRLCGWSWRALNGYPEALDGIKDSMESLGLSRDLEYPSSTSKDD